jgi:hypothetical protein
MKDPEFLARAFSLGDITAKRLKMSHKKTTTCE